MGGPLSGSRGLCPHPGGLRLGLVGALRPGLGWGGGESPSGSDQQAGGTHPTGVISCLPCIYTAAYENIHLNTTMICSYFENQSAYTTMLAIL